MSSLYPSSFAGVSNITGSDSVDAGARKRKIIILQTEFQFIIKLFSILNCITESNLIDQGNYPYCRIKIQKVASWVKVHDSSLGKVSFFTNFLIYYSNTIFL